jgi:excisionase family DNA binding protein
VTEPLRTAREIGELLGFSPATIVDWAEHDRIPCFKIGGRLRFRESEVLEWLEQGRVGPAPLTRDGKLAVERGVFEPALRVRLPASCRACRNWSSEAVLRRRPKWERFFTREDNGLLQHWTGRVFMNPPYGRTLSAWMRKAYEASQNGAELVLCLVPARTDTAWWHDYAARGEIRFLRGRLRFGGCENPAPFSSAVVVFRNAAAVTKPAGRVGREGDVAA